MTFRSSLGSLGSSRTFSSSRTDPSRCSRLASSSSAMAFISGSSASRTMAWVSRCSFEILVLAEFRYDFAKLAVCLCGLLVALAVRDDFGVGQSWFSSS